LARLILIRHGQSVWNAENRFTGWTDVDLSDKGVIEAEEAGNELRNEKIDVVHTSDLIRAKRTADIVMQHNVSSNGTVTKSDWRLNERNYGPLKSMERNRSRSGGGRSTLPLRKVRAWR